MKAIGWCVATVGILAALTGFGLIPGAILFFIGMGIMGDD